MSNFISFEAKEYLTVVESFLKNSKEFSSTDKTIAFASMASVAAIYELCALQADTNFLLKRLLEKKDA